MVNECAVNIECKFVDSKNLETMDLIIGEIVQVYCEGKCLSDNKPDYKKWTHSCSSCRKAPILGQEMLSLKHSIWEKIKKMLKGHLLMD